MKLLISVFIAICICLGFFVFYVSFLNDHNEDKRFIHFVNKYKKNYAFGSLEYQKRLSIFKDNLKAQEKLNSDTDGIRVYGINKFSDLTPKEFAERFLTKISHLKLDHTLTSVPKNVKLLKKVDWRKYVGSPRDQKSCGGCWAFSTVKCVEAKNAAKTGKFSQLSIQEVIDCSMGYKESLWGCQGGNVCSALDWLQNNNIVLTSEKNYPLTDEDGKCDSSPNSGIQLTKYICGAGEDFLQASLQKGPVAVAVDATSWIHYIGGIIKFHCEKKLNHAVLVVGYDMEGEVPYYLIQNSWGNDWGENGYLKIRMGKELCGIDQQIGLVEDIKSS